MRRHSFLGCAFLLLLSAWTACSTTDEPDGAMEPYTSTVSFLLSVYNEGKGGTRASEEEAATWGDAYSPDDTQYDAGIDPGTVCAYLTDNQGKNLLQVGSLVCYKVDESTFRYYGSIPVSSKSLLTNGTTYRCMVTANADNTTVDATFTIQDNLPNKDSETDYKIPMWGVTSFTWDGSKESQYLGVISLLRSAVKCRIRMGEELAESGYSMGTVTLFTPNISGYVLPNNYNKVSKTSDLYLVDNETDYGFRPYAVAGADVSQTTFWNEPVTESDTKGDEASPDGSNAQIVYFPEQKNTDDNPSYFEVEILKDGQSLGKKKGEFKDYESDEWYTDLQRNHVYDYEIVGVGDGSQFTLTLKQTVKDWVEETEEWDYTTQISGILSIDWDESTYYYKVDDGEKKQIILNANQAASFSFTINSPVGATWYATITSDQSDAFVIERDADDSAVVAALTTSVSGTVNGEESHLRIRATNAENSQQHTTELSVFVRYANGVVRKINELSGWQIVQTMR